MMPEFNPILPILPKLRQAYYDQNISRFHDAVALMQQQQQQQRKRQRLMSQLAPFLHVNVRFPFLICSMNLIESLT